MVVSCDLDLVQSDAKRFAQLATVQYLEVAGQGHGQMRCIANPDIVRTILYPTKVIINQYNSYDNYYKLQLYLYRYLWSVGLFLCCASIYFASNVFTAYDFTCLFVGRLVSLWPFVRISVDQSAHHSLFIPMALGLFWTALNVIYKLPSRYSISIILYLLYMFFLFLGRLQGDMPSLSSSLYPSPVRLSRRALATSLPWPFTSEGVRADCRLRTEYAEWVIMSDCWWLNDWLREGFPEFPLHCSNMFRLYQQQSCDFRYSY